VTNDNDKQPDQTSLDLEKVSTITGETDFEESEGEVLEWTTHPVRRRPWLSVGVTLFVILIGILVYWATDSNVFTVLALVVLYASLAKFYFPTHYRLNSKGVVIKSTTQTLKKPWSMYRSYYPDKKGVLLSPFTRPTRLENFRGMYLMCADNRNEVIDYIKRFVEPISGDDE